MSYKNEKPGSDHSLQDEKFPAEQVHGTELIATESKVTTKALLVGATITMGGFLFGYDIGVISGVLIMPVFAQSQPRIEPLTARIEF